MSGGYRITVRGIMSERLCAGLPGLDRRVTAGHTVLEGDPRTGRTLDDVLTTLGNLGLDVVAVEPPTHPQED